jgi:hypothetical protein
VPLFPVFSFSLAEKWVPDAIVALESPMLLDTDISLNEDAGDANVSGLLDDSLASAGGSNAEPIPSAVVQSTSNSAAARNSGGWLKNLRNNWDFMFLKTLSFSLQTPLLNGQRLQRKQERVYCFPAIHTSSKLIQMH